MPPGSRKQRASVERRPSTVARGSLAEAALGIAAEIVAREGYDALSLRGVAARVGVSHVALLHHFPSRDQLLEAVAARGFEALLEETAEAAGSGGGASQSARRSFRRFGEAYVAWALGHGNLYRLMFASPLRAAGSHPALDAQADRLFSLVEELLRRGQHEGSVARAATGRQAFFAWSAAHGAALLLLDEQAAIPRLRAHGTRALVKAALDGVRRAIEADGNRRTPPAAPRAPTGDRSPSR